MMAELALQIPIMRLGHGRHDFGQLPLRGVKVYVKVRGVDDVPFEVGLLNLVLSEIVLTASPFGEEGKNKTYNA